MANCELKKKLVGAQLWYSLILPFTCWQFAQLGVALSEHRMWLCAYFVILYIQILKGAMTVSLIPDESQHIQSQHYLILTERKTFSYFSQVLVKFIFLLNLRTSLDIFSIWENARINPNHDLANGDLTKVECMILSSCTSNYQ